MIKDRLIFIITITYLVIINSTINSLLHHFVDNLNILLIEYTVHAQTNLHSFQFIIYIRIIIPIVVSILYKLIYSLFPP